MTLFWEEIFHATIGKKAQACIQGALLFFPFKFGWEMIFFHFPLVHAIHAMKTPKWKT
jgi:hypothetical protein